MAVVGSQVAATGTAGVLVAAETVAHSASDERYAGQRTVVISNPTGGAAIFLGGDATVTASGAKIGYSLAAGAAPLTLFLAPDEAIYVIASGSTIQVSVLISGS